MRPGCRPGRAPLAPRPLSLTLLLLPPPLLLLLLLLLAPLPLLPPPAAVWLDLINGLPSMVLLLPLPPLSSLLSLTLWLMVLLLYLPLSAASSSCVLSVRWGEGGRGGSGRVSSGVGQGGLVTVPEHPQYHFMPYRPVCRTALYRPLPCLCADLSATYGKRRRNEPTPCAARYAAAPCSQEQVFLLMARVRARKRACVRVRSGKR